MANDRPLDRSDQWVQAAARDRNSFGHLFDLFHPQIFAYCSRRLLVRAVAEDVAAEVFLKVAKAIDSFQGSTTEDFRRWLFRIATNEINAQLRKSIRQRTILEAAVGMGAVGRKLDNEILVSDLDLDVDWAQVYQAIDELDNRAQSIVSLRFFGKQSHQEIASILGIKSGAVRVALSRALAKLRDRLRELLSDSNSTKPTNSTTSSAEREEQR